MLNARTFLSLQAVTTIISSLKIKTKIKSLDNLTVNWLVTDMKFNLVIFKKSEETWKLVILYSNFNIWIISTLRNSCRKFLQFRHATVQVGCHPWRPRQIRCRRGKLRWHEVNGGATKVSQCHPENERNEIKMKFNSAAEIYAVV